MFPTTWICRTLAMGVPFCEKCLGFMFGKNPKMRKWSHWFLLLVSSIGKKVIKTWAREVGNGIWGIWNARNKFYFEKIHAHPKAIPDWAVVFLHEYQNLVAAQRNSWYTLSGSAVACSGVLLFFFSSALVFLHWIVATCSVWAAVFLFYTNFSFGIGFSWQHWF